MSLAEVLAELKTGQAGLSFNEAKKRLDDYGPNKLPEAKPLSRTIIFFSQFKSPLIYILLIAAVIALSLKEYADMIVILAAVAVNAIIGFFQENKAERAISRLKKMVEYKTTVVRDGVSSEIDVANLAPGDIIAIAAGDKIPADARLLEANNLEAVEAALTGESMPSAKKIKKLAEGVTLAERENMVYLGTVAERGRGLAVVTETGARTELGQVATLIRRTKEDRTPLQKRLARFGRFLGLVVLVISLIILAEGLLTGRGFYEMLMVAIAIAVAAIPEGLLVAVTVILALGMQAILKQNALVRKLIAAETLGSATVICSDKTGTLTEGQMRVAHILSGFEKLSENGRGWGHFQNELEKYRHHLKTLEIALLCNDAAIENPRAGLAEWRMIGSPTEKALLLAATEAGLDQAELFKKHRRLSEIPFESDIKFMATLHRLNDGQNIICVKGAPEKILAMTQTVKDKGGEVNLTKERQAKIQQHYERLTAEGLRVLAVGHKIVSRKIKELKPADFLNARGEIIFGGLVFNGVLGLKDPLRSEAGQAIKECRRAGIRPIIVTGDHKLTAQAIAREVGLPVDDNGVLEGREIDKLDQKEFNRIIKKINVYARVEPRHKLRLIDALQAQGEVVAMTGDGINDAPAIKSADIGIALGSGTDVAKETSDIILLDNNFKTIVAAIRQGREIFNNLRKVIVYLLADSFTEMILIGGAILFGFPLPVLAVQILWVNLIADGLPSFALAFEKADEGIMDEPPRRPDEPILNAQMKALIFIIGIVTDLILFAVFFYLYQLGGDMNYIRTFMFMALGVDSLFYIYSCRNLNRPIYRQNPFSNRYLNGAVLFGLITLAAAVYLPWLRDLLKTVPLAGRDWFLLAILSLFKLALIEITKRYFIIRRQKITA